VARTCLDHSAAHALAATGPALCPLPAQRSLHLVIWSAVCFVNVGLVGWWPSGTGWIRRIACALLLWHWCDAEELICGSRSDAALYRCLRVCMWMCGKRMGCMEYSSDVSCCGCTWDLLAHHPERFSEHELCSALSVISELRRVAPQATRVHEFAGSRHAMVFRWLHGLPAARSGTPALVDAI
jgi:hypothetical protein